MGMSIERELTGTFMMLPFLLVFRVPSKRNNEGAWVTVTVDSKLVHACVRMNGAGPFVHDPLDSVGAAAALGAESEAGITPRSFGAVAPLFDRLTAPDHR